MQAQTGLKAPRHYEDLHYLYPFWYKAPVSKPYTTSMPVEWVHLRPDIRESRVEGLIELMKRHGMEEVEPIYGVRIYHDIFLQDGNHRTVAYQRLGSPRIKARLESRYYDEVLRMSLFAETEEGWQMRYPTGVQRHDTMPEGYKELEGIPLVSWHFQPIDEWQYEHLQALNEARGIGDRKLRRQILRWIEELG